MRVKKILNPRLMTKISKEDDTDFPDFLKNLVFEANIIECELADLLIERAPHPEDILSCHVGIDHRCLEILMA